MATYAIIETGGKQYRVQPGDTIEVELLPDEVGSSLEFDQVLLVGADERVTVGHPTVEGGRVVAEVQEHGRGEKIVVFKYKSKVRYRRKQGHRQSYTKLAIKDIVTSESGSRRVRVRGQASGT